MERTYLSARSQESEGNDVGGRSNGKISKW